MPAARVATARENVSFKGGYDSDLIVVCKHGTYFAEELFIGRETTRMISEVQCDVLAVMD